MQPLSKFATDQLIEELVRRRNQVRVGTPKHWCHDCSNFVAWNEAERNGQMPDSFNPCTKSHVMQFIAPVEIDDTYGFYRTICGDRNAIA